MSTTATLTLIGAGILTLLWVIHRVRVAAHKTSPGELEAAMRRHPAGSGYETSPFNRRPIPGVTVEHVTPLDPADLPTVTTDDEALEVMRRLAIEAGMPDDLADRAKRRIEEEG